MRVSAAVRRGAALLCPMLFVLSAATASLRAQSSTPVSAGPFGLNALNAAYRLKLGELSMDLQQGGMSHYAPFIYPLVTVNGAETWGLDYDRRQDHLFFTITYGRYRETPPEIVIKATDVPSVISVQRSVTKSRRCRCRLIRRSIRR